MVLLLFDSPAGHALFKVLDEGKLKEAETKVGKKGRWLNQSEGCGWFAQMSRMREVVTHAFIGILTSGCLG